ncbi:hypothetical protein J5N97_016156 [Dioscorea zingiberensis]|uniref:soluble epoxide hydrolase n=1 Tax=Dioscorea zingiberensis TaxID=325984 RepID=A0A9D5HEY0_9LILI|nr:hypothetical protein J5N97_016156 [Dioscorea zingiberensis]
MDGEVKHHRVRTNGIWMHVAEQGSTGPLVLLIHGFPELWFSWRHQMAHLSRHGYHVIAPDLRGYGETDAPTDPLSYSCFHIVGDIIGLIDHFEAQQVFVVGHDWGACVAWWLCQFRPDRVRALVNLAVPFFPRSPIKPSDVFKMFGEGFYINQFQEYGRAEKSFARYDVLTVMKKFLLLELKELNAPPGVEIIDFLETPLSLPPWITEEELQYFASKFHNSGFTGPFNYYRMMDMNWEFLAPWHGAKVFTPTKFIVGNKDVGFQSYGTEEFITSGAFKDLVPNLEVVIIDGHHFIQQERADKVTNEILSFLDSFPKDIV